MKVKDYMKIDLAVIEKDKTFKEAVAIMIEKGTNSLIVVDDPQKLHPVGILSSLCLIKEVLPDYLEDDPSVSAFEREGQLACFSLKSKGKKVQDIMSSLEAKLSPDDNMVEAASHASQSSMRTLPVVDENNHLVGYITRTCIKKAIYDSLFKEREKDCECNLCNKDTNGKGT